MQAFSKWRSWLAAVLVLVSGPAAAALYEANPANFGTALADPTNCDDCFSEPIGFGGSHSLSFFGTTYTTLYVGSNGYVTFGAGQSDYTPDPLDIQTLAPMIAGVYTDLDSRNDATSQVFVNTATPGQIIVTWVGMGHFNQDYSVRSTFQLVIRSDQFPVPPGQGRIGFFYDAVSDTHVASAGFGDGLAARNSGGQAFHYGVASLLSGNAGRWYNLGAGGVPVPSPTGAVAVPSLSNAGLMIMAGLMMLVVGLFRRRAC